MVIGVIQIHMVIMDTVIHSLGMSMKVEQKDVLYLIKWIPYL